MAEINVNSNNFEEEVLRSEKPVLLDFWAPWCGPCKMLSHVIYEIAKEHPEIKVCKVNVDDNMELATKFRVSGIPMVAVIKDGKIVNSSVGYRPKQQIAEML